MSNTNSNVSREYNTNEGDVAVVLEYISYENVIVKFRDSNTPTDFTLKCQLGDLRRGRVKNPYRRQICCIGYKGVGEYLTSVNGKNTKCWRVWSNMIKRCYDKNDKSYSNYGAKGITVCDSWHNFQNFAKWYTENAKEGWEIDKDLFGGMCYSPNNCTMLPKELNSFFKNKTLTNPRNGVRYDGKSYIAQITADGERYYLGRYKNEEDAIDVFRKEKLRLMRIKVENFKKCLDKHTLERLEVIINDYS